MKLLSIAINAMAFAAVASAIAEPIYHPVMMSNGAGFTFVWNRATEIGPKDTSPCASWSEVQATSIITGPMANQLESAIRAVIFTKTIGPNISYHPPESGLITARYTSAPTTAFGQFSLAKILTCQLKVIPVSGNTEFLAVTGTFGFKRGDDGKWFLDFAKPGTWGDAVKAAKFDFSDIARQIGNKIDVIAATGGTAR